MINIVTEGGARVEARTCLLHHVVRLSASGDPSAPPSLWGTAPPYVISARVSDRIVRADFSIVRMNPPVQMEALLALHGENGGVTGLVDRQSSDYVSDGMAFTCGNTTGAHALLTSSRLGRLVVHVHGHDVREEGVVSEKFTAQVEVEPAGLAVRLR